MNQPKCHEADCPNPGAVYATPSKLWCVTHYWLYALRKEAEIIAEGVYAKHKPGRKPKDAQSGQD